LIISENLRVDISETHIIFVVFIAVAKDLGGVASATQLRWIFMQISLTPQPWRID